MERDLLQLQWRQDTKKLVQWEPTDVDKIIYQGPGST